MSAPHFTSIQLPLKALSKIYKCKISALAASLAKMNQITGEKLPAIESGERNSELKDKANASMETLEEC